MSLINKIITKFKRKITNKRNDQMILSAIASSKAKYGRKVLIDVNTYVSDDVEIGDYSYVNRNSSIESCKIGKFCSISSNVYISPFNHDYGFVTTHPFVYNKLYKMVDNDNARLEINKEITIIGNDVWIGLNAIIRRGVKIGDGSVIGAGAVVVCDIPQYQIWGGVPAKFIKNRFDETVSNVLRKMQWWDWDYNMIKQRVSSFRCPKDFIDQGVPSDGRN